ncbi:MAG: TIGR03936 family radical SAM-associated protein [Candidatus Omnitrophica bacterium]|nr:TIGR03936 family radical SAM-associated protein [Candidatus Omnitrophota bacterium]MCM8790439.1 TIGR03936 family radical SAM-associated protein [Candidatus Omnitrophota bacterium]
MSCKLMVKFSKTGDMAFISHLDLLRLFQRASRRAGLPVTITKGFSPRLKISIKRALKLGLESQSEEAVFYLDKPVRPQDFIDSINAKLPEDVKVLTAEEEKF